MKYMVEKTTAMAVAGLVGIVCFIAGAGVDAIVHNSSCPTQKDTYMPISEAVDKAGRLTGDWMNCWGDNSYFRCAPKVFGKEEFKERPMVLCSQGTCEMFHGPSQETVTYYVVVNSHGVTTFSKTVNSKDLPDVNKGDK